VLAGFVIAGLTGKHVFEREEKQPPHPSPTQRQPSADVWTFASQQFAVVVLVLGIVASAFGLQGWLLSHVAWLKDDYLPIVVIAYLGGAVFRLLFEAILGAERFPEQALGVLLLGPTMGIVLSYALMSIPLALLGYLGLMEIAAALAVGTSVVAARVALSVFAKLTDRYYAAVISTAFLAVTTGWGPLAMSYLRCFTTAKGPVPVMPVVLPLNAFFVFPWMVILLTRFVLAMFG
jgi:ESS family glutamate:Na+ symporter